ncbi:MAG: hypothetical protein JNL49_02980 [Bacteroidia bacterium]|jgi:hypothetical protein|nr:hypothetical protein [Bacteroidia bacterium]
MVVKLSWENIVDLILSTKKRFILIMPAIHEEWIDVIDQINDLDGPIEMKFCIDNHEMAVRKGYGSIKSIDRLRNNYHDINECSDLRINFLCVDDVCYLIFLESRILEGSPAGYNAIKLNKDTGQVIIDQFFEKHESLNPNGLISTPLNEAQFEQVQEALMSNPPSEPDLQRQINTYKTHFQYAEIHFEGGGLQNKTVNIPKDALPFKDSELKKRMKTSFNLFSKEDVAAWEDFTEIKNKIAEIRIAYLHPCKLKRGRSIIKKTNKEAYVNDIILLKEMVESKRNEMLESIQNAIFHSKDLLTTELTLFFQVNPPDQIIGINDEVIKTRMIKDIIDKILIKTKIPHASELINKMTIDDQYSEFTEEDLSNKEFLDWFNEKGLIDKNTDNEIANFEKAYKIRN